MAVSRHLGFCRTANSAFRSADPENPRTKHGVDRMHRLRDIRLYIRYSLYFDLETGVRGHSRSSKVALFDRAHTTLYSSSTVHVTIPLHVSITVSEI